MADSGLKELSDFFAKKKKSKVKSSNLNIAPTDTKVDQSQQKMAKEEEGWEDEQIQTTQLKMDIAGKLTREEDKREEEVQTVAWGGGKKSGKAKSTDPAPLSAAVMDKKFPTLGKATRSSNINLDGGDGKVAIKTTKNVFSALEGEGGSSDEEADKRPKQIKPAMVTKTKGEKEAVALQREKDKYVDKKSGSTRKSTAKEDASDSGDDAEHEAKPAPKEKASTESAPPSEQPKGRKAAARQDTAAPQDSAAAADLKIVPDPVAARAKYEGRRKLERKPLPPSELKEKPKETKQGKKKRLVCVEEDDKPTLAYIKA